MMSDPPSIVFVASRPPIKAGGPQTVATFLHFASRGWDAHLVFDGGSAGRGARVPELSTPASRERVHLSRAHRPRGAKRLTMPLGVIRGLAGNRSRLGSYFRTGGRPRLSLLRGHDVEAALIALRPQLVHFDSPSSAAKRLRVKRLWRHGAVVTLTPEELHASEDGARYGAIWDDADVLECPDERTWQEAVRAGCSPRKPRALIPLPFDTAFFDPGSVDAADPDRDASQALRLVSVGPLSWRQGYEWALQAVRQLLDSGVRCAYRIAGGGDYADAVYFARYELDLEHIVSVSPAPSREELREHLRWANVYLDSAVVAGAINAIPEALAMGLPVAATDRTAFLEGAVDAETGFVVPRRDPGALAEPLAKLAARPDLRREMGHAARQRALGIWGLDQYLAERERVYRGLLETSTKGSALNRSPSSSVKAGS